VRRLEGEKFQVFAINCTHLGCPVRWFQESGLFMCPCHGGVYYADGSRASGPPPRGLFEYEYKIQNGHLWVLGGQLPTLSSHPEA
jgi:Rieske Fe-S protein